MNESMQVVECWARLWSDPDAAGANVEALFSTQCRYEDVPFGETFRGHAATRSYRERSFQAFPDFAVVVDSIIIGDDGAACVSWSMSGTHKGDLLGLSATGRAVSMRGVSVMRIADGKILQCTDYYDAATMMRQLTDAV